MTTTPYPDLEVTWNSANRYTAGSDADILIVHTGAAQSAFDVRWTITNDDTLPSINVADGGRVRGGEQFPMQILSGERLWLAGSAGARASVID